MFFEPMMLLFFLFIHFPFWGVAAVCSIFGCWGRPGGRGDEGLERCSPRSGGGRRDRVTSFGEETLGPLACMREILPGRLLMYRYTCIELSEQNASAKKQVRTKFVDANVTFIVSRTAEAFVRALQQRYDNRCLLAACILNGSPRRSMHACVPAHASQPRAA